MRNPDAWKKLFGYALERLTAAKLPENSWSFGGGMVLMLKYNHRFSKDIDIFFRDQQLLAAVSPRINDAAEASILDYSEHTQFTKIQFAEGEVDFIVSRQLTDCQPEVGNVLGRKVYVDSPVEIVAKKIFFRADEFKPRDLFDLAVVYSALKSELLKNAFAFSAQLHTLEQRIGALASSGQLGQSLQALDVAPGGKAFRGRELAVCRQFLRDVANKD
ncbi:nucleotidyl transferase AbiEii/AbiGii toxin family protein [Desulfovibrio sp. OttesenSCG-928-C14]|nr:nucleotidyl transferase AbiEii/AbiGii toxin family protein [Desulfovibrio sp. OttesenSCG-928-C14]